MVRKIRYGDLQKITSENRLTVAMFYAKECSVCNHQEKELDLLKKQLNNHGIAFVKLDVNKDGIEKSMGIKSVPTIMMWVPSTDERGQEASLNVGFRFEKSGKIFFQINGRIENSKLLKAISILLNESGS